MLLTLLYATGLVVIAVCSLWIKKDPKIWGSFLALSFFFQIVSIRPQLKDMGFIILLIILWVLYKKKESFILFLTISTLSLLFKILYIPGFTTFFFGHLYILRFQGALTGILPLALILNLAKTKEDWLDVLITSSIAFIGVVLLGLLATFLSATFWEFTIPSLPVARLTGNLFFTSIPEEGLYRGLIQGKLCEYLKNIKFGGTISIVFTSIIYTIIHLYGEITITVGIFLFLSSILFGFLYYISNRIESSIICHFFIVIMHAIFFRDHPL